MNNAETKPAGIDIVPNRPDGTGRIALRTAAILLVFTFVFTALMAGTYQITAPTIKASALEQKLRLIGEVLPAERYDNDLLKDAIVLPATAGLNTELDSTLYRARQQGKPAALVFEAAANDGYSGRIELILAVAADGTLIAQRVTLHKETPGLGDYIDPRKDRNKANPWIKQFNDKDFDTIPREKWRVRKDGGEFDQMAGATISARAVTNASRQALEWAVSHRDSLFELGAGARFPGDTMKDSKP